MSPLNSLRSRLQIENTLHYCKKAFPTSVLQLSSPICSHWAPSSIACPWKVHKLISLQHRLSLFCWAESLRGETSVEIQSMSNLSLGILGNAFSRTPTVTEWLLEYSSPSMQSVTNSLLRMGDCYFPRNYIKHRISQSISWNGEECAALSPSHPALSIFLNALFVFDCVFS